ncbi:MAG TPA: UbiA-like polyprenyltransferase [Acidobacteriota bacterium]|nr:UbiA-like polyprenyltransferase [Acidobacteriota bacterium]
MPRSRGGVWAAFIKVEHTLFSLPMLLAGALVASGGQLSWPPLGWAVVAGIGARTLAMALNRLIDRRIDAANPRTRDRELPSGAMSVAEGWGIAGTGLLIYLAACARLPPLCLWLSPIPVVVFVGYPYLKRVTPLAHFGVGLALALAPLGGHVAVTGSLESASPALLLALFTLLWVAGFDIIYATLDEGFDRSAGLHSLPSRLGAPAALRVSALAHAVAVGALLVLYFGYLDGFLSAALLFGVGILLAAEQRLADRVSLAFFQINIVVGFVVLAFVVAGLAGI